jgi:hypothetical protein
VQYIWVWFNEELNSCRDINGMALPPITHTEITSWADGMKIDLLPFERRALKALDNAYTSYFNSKSANG